MQFKLVSRLHSQQWTDFRLLKKLILVIHQNWRYLGFSQAMRFAEGTTECVDAKLS